MNAISKRDRAPLEAAPLHLLDLSFAGQMTIWGLRLLSVGQRADVNVNTRLLEGFDKSGAAQACWALIVLADTLFKNLARDFRVNCPCNPVLSNDEQLFVEICTDAQHNPGATLNARSSAFLLPRMVAVTDDLFVRYANALTSAGILFREAQKPATWQATARAISAYVN